MKRAFSSSLLGMPTSLAPRPLFLGCGVFRRVGAASALISLLLLGCAKSDKGPPQSPTEPPAPPPAATTAPVTVFGQASPPLPSPAVVGSPDIAALVEKVQPAVVNITTSSNAPAMRMIDPFEFFFGPQNNPFRLPQQTPGETPMRQQHSLGSGFVIDADGYVVTNSHVVEGADEVTVRFADDKQYKAKVVGRDARVDIALLRLEGAPKLTPIVLGDSDALRVGQYVVAVGNPFGLGHTVTMGIVSAKDRTIGAGPYDDFIQTDASINPGNSGGPLFNLRGELVGINTAIHRQGQGIGFAIPINMVRDSILQLKTHGHVSRGMLGLVFQPVTPDIAKALSLDSPRGALVAQVNTPGPAQKAGLQVGDVITHVNDKPVQRSSDLPRMIASHRPGTSVKITYLRNGKQRTSTVVLDTLDSNETSSKDARKKGTESSPSFGLTLQRQADGSIAIAKVTGKLSAHLMTGDVIENIDGKAIRQPGQVSKLLAAARKANRPALMRLRRDGATLFVAVNPDD